jgi:phenylacetate-CoA ligase
LGRTCIVGYTKRDLFFWRELMARVMAAAGVTAQDIVQLTFSYGLETGGIAFELGAETLGASVVPAGQAARSVQIGIMRDFRSTVLGATPSYAWRLMEYMEETDVDPKRLDLRLGLFGAEPWSEDVRAKLADRMFIDCYDVYGLAELIGPGVAGECAALSGLHLAEDHFFPEIIDPETETVLPPGEEGELVLTTLRREAQPLIRYRTGDLTRLETASCACGRTHARMARISKRTDDIIIFGGVSVLPREVGTVLAGFPMTGDAYEIKVSRNVMPGELYIHVEVDDQTMQSDEVTRQQVAFQIKSELKQVTGADFIVTLHPSGALAQATGRNGHVVWE